jgi:hypothetical protein
LRKTVRYPEGDVVDLPLAGGHECVHERGIDPVDRSCETVRVGGIVEIVEDLNFHLAHEEDAAVASALAVALHLGRGGPFEVELAVAEFLAAADVARAGDALEGAVLDDPLGRFRGILVRGPFFESGGGSIEEDDGVGGWFAGLFLRAEGARFDAPRLRAVHVVDGPWVGFVRRVAVEAAGGWGWKARSSREGSREREEGYAHGRSV